MSKLLILVIGATGAQGMAVVSKLLAQNEDGTPSPFAVRALTRDPTHWRARQLEAMGAELYKGSFYDMEEQKKFMDGCYGAFINTDTYTVGEEKEIWAAIKLYETARRTSTMRHWLFSNLDYGSKLGDFDLQYKSEHHDAKGVVNDWLQAQPSFLGDGLTWTSLTTSVYMEMLNLPLCGPLNIREDGTRVFATPIQDGHIPMIALSDLAWWVRYIFEHREETSGKELLVASDWVSWDYLVETFKGVTGLPAVHKRLTLDEWFGCLTGHDHPIANEKKLGDGSITMKQSFTGFWSLWRDDMVKRDFDSIRSIHPKSLKLADWMKQTGYKGEVLSWTPCLKNAEQEKGIFRVNKAVASSL